MRVFSFLIWEVLVERPAMTQRSEDLHIHSEAFLHRLMRRQLRLSMGCAAAFLVALLGLPLLNYFAPEFMASRLAGFTLSWFLLGVFFFPLVWVIAFYFIRRSIALEEAEAEWVRKQP
jgi:uncharacterized membrane protein (DUF485 family)